MDKNVRLNEIAERLKEINEVIDTTESKEELDAYNKEIDELIGERNKIMEDIQSRQAMRNKVAIGAIGKVDPVTPTAENEAEERAKKFVASGRTSVMTDQLRSVLVSSGKLATPTAVNGINDIVGAKHSSILDFVKIVNCEGMGKNRVAYIDEDAAEADAQTEGSEATTKEPKFGYVDITPESIAVTSQISKQVKKQSPLQYEMKVQEQALISLRKAAVSRIVSKLKASELNRTLNAELVSGKGKLTETTLTDLILDYGGDESIVGEAMLFINKTDLKEIGKIRGSENKKPVFEVIPDGSNPNIGIIKDGGLSVRYCICSALTACTGTAQSDSAIPTMFYGNPQCLELDLFSNYEINVSSDFAFTKLMDTILGDVELGADVVVKNGFVALTIPATT